jgi:hypothetical protein
VESEVGSGGSWHVDKSTDFENLEHSCFRFGFRTDSWMLISKLQVLCQKPAAHPFGLSHQLNLLAVERNEKSLCLYSWLLQITIPPNPPNRSWPILISQRVEHAKDNQECWGQPRLLEFLPGDFEQAVSVKLKLWVLFGYGTVRNKAYFGTCKKIG